MAEEKKMAKCEVCGNSLELKPEEEGSGIMECCGKQMKIINIGG